MTLRDYGRMGLFIAGGGMADGKRIVPKDWVTGAATRQGRSTAARRRPAAMAISGGSAHPTNTRRSASSASR